MKIYITTQGDRSVGLEPDLITLDWNIRIFSERERKMWRTMLTEQFTEMTDNGKVMVRFEDETEEGGVLPRYEVCSYTESRLGCHEHVRLSLYRDQVRWYANGIITVIYKGIEKKVFDFAKNKSKEDR